MHLHLVVGLSGLPAEDLSVDRLIVDYQNCGHARIITIGFGVTRTKLQITGAPATITPHKQQPRLAETAVISASTKRVVANAPNNPLKRFNFRLS